MKIPWTLARAGEICKVQGQLQYQTSFEHFSTAALGKAWLTTLHAYAGRPFAGAMAELWKAFEEVGDKDS